MKISKIISIIADVDYYYDPLILNLKYSNGEGNTILSIMKKKMFI